MSLEAMLSVMARSKAKGEARLVLMALAARKNIDTGLCCPSMSTVALDTGLWRSRVGELIVKLETLGELSHVNRAGPRGGTSSNSYEIHLTEGVHDPGHPVSVIPDRGCPGSWTEGVRNSGQGVSVIPDCNHKMNPKENEKTESKITTTTRSRGRAAKRPGGSCDSFGSDETATSPHTQDSVKHSDEAGPSSSPVNGPKAQPPGCVCPPSRGELTENQFLRGFANVWSNTSTSEYEDKLSRSEISRVRKLLNRTRSEWEGIGLEGLILRFAFARFAWQLYAQKTIERDGEYDEAAFPAKLSQSIGVFFGQLGAVGRWYTAHNQGAARGGFDERGTRTIVTSIARYCDAPWLAEEFLADNEEDYREACPEIDEERVKNGRTCRFNGYIAGREGEKSAELWMSAEAAKDAPADLADEDAYIEATEGLHGD